MIGVWSSEGGVRVREDLREPEAGGDEVVVAVTLAGICGTDLGLLDRSPPFIGIPGHEFVGTVVKGPEAWAGERVVAEINVSCDDRSDATTACSECVAGRPTHCRSRSAVGIFGRDGVFAKRVALPIRNLHRVPDAVTDEAASFIEPLAAAFRVLEQVEIEESTRVLVVGPGRLGSLVARAIASTGVRPSVAGRSPAGLDRARAGGFAALPVSDIVSSSFDVAVDCTGHPDGFAYARKALRPGGTLVLKSTYPTPIEFDGRSAMVDEIRIVGSRCGPFPAAISALARGEVDVVDLIDGRFPLAEAVDAFRLAARPGVAKVLLEP